MIMKKVWLVLLATVLVFGLAVFGCGGGSSSDDDDDDDGDGVVFKLSAVLEEIGEKTGVVEADFNGFPLSLAGGPTTVITKDGDAFVIQLTTTANWGEGLDVCHGTGDDKFLFKAGDVIKITGKALNNFPPAPTSGDTWATPCVQFKVDQGSNNATDADYTNIHAGEAYEFEYTLTEGDIEKIEIVVTDNPANIRIGARPTGAQFQITEITVTR